MHALHSRRSKTDDVAQLYGFDLEYSVGGEASNRSARAGPVMMTKATESLAVDSQYLLSNNECARRF